jgi:hypothetical protein
MNEKEIEKLYFDAGDKAAVFVEEQARAILRKHPSLHEFTMAMGTWFFTVKRSKDRSLLPGEHAVLHDPPSYIKNSRLASFILKWDEYLKITGEPMRFTADGPVVRDW